MHQTRNKLRGAAHGDLRISLGAGGKALSCCTETASGCLSICLAAPSCKLRAMKRQVMYSTRPSITVEFCRVCLASFLRLLCKSREKDFWAHIKGYKAHQKHDDFGTFFLTPNSPTRSHLSPDSRARSGPEGRWKREVAPAPK